MKPGTRLRLRWFLGFFWILAWASIAMATPPSTPITVHLELSHVPTDPHEWAMLTVEVRSVLDAPDTYVELILPDGVSADRTNWVVNLQADTPVTLTPTWRSISSPGNYTISVRALKFVDAGAVWGDMKSISFHSTPVAAASKMGLEVDNVPVASLSRQGSITPISMEPTPFLFPSLAERVFSPEELPSAEPAQNPKPISPIPSSPGTVTLIGKWRYADRSNIARDLDQQLIEIRNGDGSALSPPIYCFTDVNGSFSCSITQPGTTMRVWVRSYMNFSILGKMTGWGYSRDPK